MSRLIDIAAGIGAANGEAMMRLVGDAYPLCRSITGDGLRETLALVGGHVDIEIHEVPSGTNVFDWTVPDEWNIRDAFVADTDGRRIIDFRRSNLHVVSYSEPVNRRMRFDALAPHLHSLPEHPDWIPYRTSYYKRSWGFCLAHSQLLAMQKAGADRMYDVVIDASLGPGSLSYGEVFLPGRSADEILLTTHACHPSMCNDNLSGVTVLAQLARLLRETDRHHSIRCLFMPGTIGAISWLALNRDNLHNIRHGLVLAGLGDTGPLTYKRSRDGTAMIDRAVETVLARTPALADQTPRVVDFSPYGYDERQFNSPGIALPVGRLSRSEYGSYPEYHTSADNLDFIQPTALTDSLRALVRVIAVLDENACWRNTEPYCEPQLGKRGLYDAADAGADWEQVRLALLWVLNLGDGRHDLLHIAERSGLPFEAVARAARRLTDAGLLERMERRTD
jgi:aminopeptidase-like protein